MNIRASILLLAGCCFIVPGCRHQAAIPEDSFHLTVEHIITDNEVIVSLLKIRTSHNASISVKGDDFHEVIANTGEEARVDLAASRITRHGDRFAYIQTLIRPEGPNGAFAGGPAIYSVPAATKLASYLAVSVTDGNYKIDAPVEIARLDGKPVMLVVGKPINQMAMLPDTALKPAPTDR